MLLERKLRQSLLMFHVYNYLEIIQHHKGVISNGDWSDQQLYQTFNEKVVGIYHSHYSKIFEKVFRENLKILREIFIYCSKFVIWDDLLCVHVISKVGDKLTSCLPITVLMVITRYDFYSYQFSVFPFKVGG